MLRHPIHICTSTSACVTSTVPSRWHRSSSSSTPPWREGSTTRRSPFPVPGPVPHQPPTAARSSPSFNDPLPIGACPLPLARSSLSGRRVRIGRAKGELLGDRKPTQSSSAMTMRRGPLSIPNPGTIPDPGTRVGSTGMGSGMQVGRINRRPWTRGLR
jgi:hypothetical protein